MKAEDTLTIINGALDGLAQDLAGGHSEQLTRYLSFMGRFHDYSFGNTLLIWSQRPDATHVAGYNTWKSMGRQVRKGEKGIAIRAPMTLRTTSEQQTSDDGRKDQETILRFRIAHVFDIAQTDGDELPEMSQAEGEPGPMLERLRAFADRRGILVETDASLTGAQGVSRGGRIGLRPGLSPAEEFSTLAHELAHELLHRDPGTRPSKAVRELEAEAVAFAVSTAAGLSIGTASKDYIHMYQGDAEALHQSLARIRGVSHEIASALRESDKENARAAA